MKIYFEDISKGIRILKEWIKGKRKSKITEEDSNNGSRSNGTCERGGADSQQGDSRA